MFTLPCNPMSPADELLPPTQPYAGAGAAGCFSTSVSDRLFLKPSAGMHGKGALRLAADETAGGSTAETGKPAYRPSALPTGLRPLDCHSSFRRRLHYLVQPCLSCPTGKAFFDVRALMQKDDQRPLVLHRRCASAGQSGQRHSQSRRRRYGRQALEALRTGLATDAANKL